MSQNNFFLGCFDWSHAFNFRIGKAVPFDFNEKLTQNVAQITLIWCTTKDFLHLHFAVDRVLSISEPDLENGRMTCQWKYWIKNIAVKILILILFCFYLLCWLSPVSVVAASFFGYLGPCRWF